MRLALALALLAAGCGDTGGGDENRSATADQIERLSTPKKEVVDPQAAVRLRPLGLTDLDSAGMPDPACEFSRDGRLLVAATAGDAIARVGGRLLHFTHASPMAATGGFFEDRQVSISVGRTGPGATGAGPWPARATVTNRRSEASATYDGVWRCEG